VTFVPPWIPPHPILLFVGQSPAKEEARLGRPFIGTDGQQLRKWVTQLGLDPDTDCAYTNVVQEYRGTFNYTPTSMEIKEAGKRIRGEVARGLFSPRAVVLLGAYAARTSFKGRMGRMHGQMKPGALLFPPVFACWHPGAYRNAISPEATRSKEADILEVIGKAIKIARGEGVPTVELPEYEEKEGVKLT